MPPKARGRARTLSPEALGSFGGGGDLVRGDSHTLVLQTGSEIGEQCLVGLSGTGGGVDGYTVGVDGDAADLVPVEDGVTGVLRGGVGSRVEGAGLFLVEGGGDLADGRLRAGDSDREVLRTGVVAGGEEGEEHQADDRGEGENNADEFAPGGCGVCRGLCGLWLRRQGWGSRPSTVISRPVTT